MHQEHIINLNVKASNNRNSKHVKERWIKETENEQIHNHIWGFQSSQSTMEKGN